MKTFTQIYTYPAGSCGHEDNSRMINVIEADPKRKGMYKMSQYQTRKGKKAAKFSIYYGKCNQAKILAESKSMIEVA